HLVRREPAQHAAGIAPLDVDLGHERHVHEDHTLATGLVLALPRGPPRWASPGERARIGRLPVEGVPIGALPAADVAEEGPLRGQLLMNGRALGPTRRRHGAHGVMALVHEAERFHRARAPILGRYLE